MNASTRPSTTCPSMEVLLERLITLGGSDLHLTTQTPPQVRVHGHLEPIEGVVPLTADDTKALVYSMLDDRQIFKFESDMELDFSFGIQGLEIGRAHV